MKTLPQWSDLGVRQVDGTILPQQDLQAALVLPQGIRGPAFLVCEQLVETAPAQMVSLAGQQPVGPVSDCFDDTGKLIKEGGRDYSGVDVDAS